MAHDEVTNEVLAEPARGDLLIRYYGSLRNKEVIIWERLEQNVTCERIIELLHTGEFYLPKEAGRRKGWSFHSVECWWSYGDQPSHRQWRLTVD